jgi:hypothetical protein
MLIRCKKPPVVFDWRPSRALSWVEEGGKSGRQVVKSCLPAPIIGWKIEGVDRSQDLFFFGWAPSSLAWSGGALSSMKYMVPQSFAIGENQSYPQFRSVTGDPQYLGYKTPTIFLLHQD